jgi:transposase-like protein
MTTYPEEQKNRLTEQMLPPQNVSIAQLARETGIPRDTLYDWRRKALKARGRAPTPAARAEDGWSSEEKFAMVVETMALTAVEQGEYCRKRGIYPEHLQAWRRACEQANAPAAAEFAAARATDQKRLRALESERRRKDQALAETAALLVLRKKAQASWGDGEAD